MAFVFQNYSGLIAVILNLVFKIPFQNMRDGKRFKWCEGCPFQLVTKSLCFLKTIKAKHPRLSSGLSISFLSTLYSY